MSTRSVQVVSRAVLALFLIAAPAASTSAGGPSVVEQLSGPAIAGVVPEGQAVADESQFARGGSTILTVDVKSVNLPDGTVLDVSLDFRPVGTITLRARGGALSADLGHFGVSNDEVRVSANGNTILIGAFFR